MKTASIPTPRAISACSRQCKLADSSPSRGFRRFTTAATNRFVGSRLPAGRDDDRRQPPQSPAQSGFTLTELLFVLVALVLLALPLWAMTAKNRLAVQQIQCAGNLRQLTAYGLLYSSDTGSLLPYNDSGNVWVGTMRTYDPELSRVSVCPSAPGSVPLPTANTVGTADIAWFWSGQSGFTSSYALNGWLYVDSLSFRSVPTPPGGSMSDYTFRKESAIQKPGNTPVVLDAIWMHLWPFESDPPSLNLYSGEWSGAAIARCTIARHGGEAAANAPRNFTGGILPGAINVSLFDGHVETVRLEKLWTLYWHLNWNPANVPWPHPNLVP